MNINILKEWNTFESFKTPEDVYYDVRRLIDSYEKFKKHD